MGSPGHWQEAEWPLVYWTAGGHDTTDMQNVAAFLERFAAYLGRHERFAVVFDMRGIAMPPPAARKAMAAFQDKHASDFRDYLVADANIVDSALVRGLVVAINWLSPPPHPQRFFTDRDDAIAWARRQLQTVSSPSQGSV